MARSISSRNAVVPQVVGRPIVPTLVTGMIAATFVTASACGPSSPEPPRAAGEPKPCPVLSTPDEVAAFDFEKGYGVSEQAAETLKASVLAASELESLAERLDADLGIACARIAQDLGKQGDWRSGNDACAAALDATREARAKLGPKARIELVVRAPLCVVDGALLTKCASICDRSSTADSARAECERPVGRCDGVCDGTCEPRGPARCEGSCNGTCEGSMSGRCGGRCVGTCDGKRSGAECFGVCIGTCEHGVVDGECKGTCTGSCKRERAAICEGTCAGACSVDLSAAKCAGDFKTLAISAECRARCDLAVMSHTECAAPLVGVVLSGARDREASELVRTAVERSLPALLGILHEAGEKGAKRIATAKEVVEHTRRSLGGAGPERDGGSARAAGCFDTTFERANGAAKALVVGLDSAAAIRSELSK